MTRIALVTGGNSGIGYATAKLLADKGYEVFISGRSASKLDDAAKELNARPITADMTNLEDLESLASQFSDTGLDALVNNAGVALFAPLESYDESLFSIHMNTNVRGPLFLIQKLLPALEKRQGAITNVSSIITNHGFPNLSVYAASKGAMEAFTRTLALELSPRNIRINAVAPGAIETPIKAKMGLAPDQIESVVEQVTATIPLRRFGKPEEVAHVIVAQVESTYTTGAVWQVDGGVDA